MLVKLNAQIDCQSGIERNIILMMTMMLRGELVSSAVFVCVCLFVFLSQEDDDETQRLPIDYFSDYNALTNCGGFAIILRINIRCR